MNFFVFRMYRHFSETGVTPDYNNLSDMLDIVPHTVMDITGKKSQIAYTFKDGTSKVQGLSDQSYFLLNLQWEELSNSEHSKIMSLWHDPAKANGMERTITWLNPIDGKKYTVRFFSELTTEYGIGGMEKVYGLKLRVEGVYKA
jgi:hypothetical protein